MGLGENDLDLDGTEGSIASRRPKRTSSQNSNS